MHDEFEESSGSGPNLKSYFAIARRRRWHFLIPLFLGWVAVWGASWILPSIYRSSTLILVEQPTVPAQYVVPNISADNLQDRLQSITQQMLSRTRLMRIIDDQHLYADYRRTSSPDEIIDRMRKDIEIELVRDRDQLTAFKVYYSSRNPLVAQQVTKQLTDLFITENLEARQEQSESTTQFLENHLEEARSSLSEQEAKIREFKDQHLGDLPGQLQSNLQILSSLQAQMASEQDRLDRARQQNVYLESLLGQYRLVQRSKSVDSVPMGLPAIEQELDRLKARLADLSSHYTDLHPDVRKVREQIARTEKMKQQISVELKAGVSASTADDNSTATPTTEADVRATRPMVELESQLKVNRLEIDNRERTLAAVSRQIAEYQARLNREPVREQELADLTRNYDQSRANYESLLKKRNESELATSLERRQQGEHFRILDPPSVPIKPYSPNRVKLSLIGLVAGILLGGAVSAGTEMIDDRIYSKEDLERLEPTVGIISEIPPITTKAEEKKEARMAVLGWVGAGLEFATILGGLAISYLIG